MNRFEAMMIPHALGVCDGCRDDLVEEGGYCAACAELNRMIHARYERRLLRLAEEEEALKQEALLHAERSAALYGSLPRVDGEMPRPRLGLRALARRVWNAIF